MNKKQNKKAEEVKANYEDVTLHRFKDGHYIVNLKPEWLQEEGRAMSNCTKESHYARGVQNKEFAILALKNKSGKTLVHFQVDRKGRLDQNFEKSNTEVKSKNWKYVVDFFKRNSKNVSLDEGFDFNWTVNTDNSRVAISCNIPDRIVTDITENGPISRRMGNHSVKTFYLQNRILENNTVSLDDKDELVSQLESAKDILSDRFNDLIKQIKATEGKDLFLSDEMKGKIFGTYELSGEDYDSADVLGLRDNRNVKKAVYMDEPVYEAELAELPEGDDEEYAEEAVAMEADVDYEAEDIAEEEPEEERYEPGLVANEFRRYGDYDGGDDVAINERPMELAGRLADVEIRVENEAGGDLEDIAPMENMAMEAGVAVGNVPDGGGFNAAQ